MSKRKTRLDQDLTEYSAFKMGNGSYTGLAVLQFIPMEYGNGWQIPGVLVRSCIKMLL